jgi:hypothetical protein
MDRAIGIIGTIVALMFAAAAIYVGMTSSWTTGLLLFLLGGGIEFAVWALDGDRPSRSHGSRRDV